MTSLPVREPLGKPSGIDPHSEDARVRGVVWWQIPSPARKPREIQVTNETSEAGAAIPHPQVRPGAWQEVNEVNVHVCDLVTAGPGPRA